MSRGELLDLLADITGGDVGLSTTLPLTKPAPLVEFEERVFCLTGKFVYGGRRKCEEKIILLGGDTHPRVTHDVNYLVIGTAVSTDWIHTTHGRKIEKAVEFREKGLPISIISEEHWIDCLAKETLRNKEPASPNFPERRIAEKAARAEESARRKEACAHYFLNLTTRKETVGTRTGEDQNNKR